MTNDPKPVKAFDLHDDDGKFVGSLIIFDKYDGPFEVADLSTGLQFHVMPPKSLEEFARRKKRTTN